MRKVFAAAILVAGAVNPVVGWSAEELGRLFFTPTQRKVLDAGKLVSTQKVPVKPGPRSVRIDGVVTRSDSDRTIWVNGTAYHGGSPDGVRVKTNPATPGSASIGVPGKSQSTRVKVGQRIDLNSGQIREDLSRKADEAEEGPAAQPETDAIGGVAEKPKATHEPAQAQRDTDPGPAAAAR
jgi:hypothetical protein